MRSYVFKGKLIPKWYAWFSYNDYMAFDTWREALDYANKVTRG